MYNVHFVPDFLVENKNALYVGVMITYHRYNSPMYNMHKNMGVHYIQAKYIKQIFIVPEDSTLL